MASPRNIPETLRRAQLKASNPDGSAWVSANAGSGKTYVLAQRVTRLLLNGVSPSKILCLTFTKVAAATMALRVFDTLSAWTKLGDVRLSEEILRIEGRPPDATRLLHARRLFAEALETPGGLKVQTIHAFCSALMHQFPFESGVAAGFEVMEERAQDELINQVRTDVLLEAAQSPGSGIAGALGHALVAAADTTFAEVVKQAVMRRNAYEAWLKRARTAEAALQELDGIFDVTAEHSVETIDAEMISGGIPRTQWSALADVFAAGSPNDVKQAARLRTATAVGSLREYLSVFCSDEGDLRDRVLTKKLATRHPDVEALLDREKERLAPLLRLRRAVVARDRAAALAAITFEIIARYRAEKARRGLLDYDDLIEKTRALLGECGPAWVMYKLDLGIDHLLIDEAQDTSPAQWDVIRKLTAEFFAGAGARSHVRRSIFAVGDEKQSIYSFQGAAPHLFDEMREHFRKEHGKAELPFEPVPLLYSFRSTIDVLGAVDQVFANPSTHTGLALPHDQAATLHEAVRTESPGSVEIWPLAEAPEKRKVEPWDQPFDTLSEESAPVILARRIARYVASAIAGKEPVEAREGAPLRPGDVLVLVRQRGPLFEAVIRALKAERVAVAGADRLVLTDHIAVMDLMALADALLLRDDDLALAEVLKGPLFGFDDDDLFVLAQGRRKSLRGMLERAAEPRFAVAARRLADLEQRAGIESPYAFYARLLGADGGRREILTRLGAEADDALDEFLALALDFERSNTPSLQGFIAWLRAANAEVKRDMDVARNEVRVMTVHGAKGLEAPIVILADTTRLPRGLEPTLVPAYEAEDAPLLWLGRKGEDADAGAAARLSAHQAAEFENLRLLYVAMTRAQDRLIVCGARGVGKNNPENCWYDLVSQALMPAAVERRAADGETVWRWQKSPEQSGKARETSASVEKPPEVVPAWLRRRVEARAKDHRVSPSQSAPRRRARAPEQEAAATRARMRGTLVHRLLQSLPDVPAEQRGRAGERFLALRGRDFTAEERTGILDQANAILDHPAFAPLFGAGTQAEVPIVGTLARRNGDPVIVSGQVDRLAVTTDSVLIVDFKTDRGGSASASLAHYARQLAFYRALLRQLYPGRAVRCAIVWTESPQLQEITGEMLDRAAEEFGLVG